MFAKQEQNQQTAIVGQVANYMEMLSDIYCTDSNQKNGDKEHDSSKDTTCSNYSESSYIFDHCESEHKGGYNTDTTTDHVPPKFAMSKSSSSSNSSLLSSLGFTKNQLCNYVPRCLMVSFEGNDSDMSSMCDNFFKFFFSESLDTLEYGSILLFKISDWMVSSFQTLFKNQNISHNTDVSLYQKSFRNSLDEFTKDFFALVEIGFSSFVGSDGFHSLSILQTGCMVNILIFLVASSVPTHLVFTFTQSHKVNVPCLTAYEFWFHYARYFEKYHSTESWIFSYCRRFVTLSPYCSPSVFPYLMTSYDIILLGKGKENNTIAHVIVSNLMAQTIINKLPNSSTSKMNNITHSVLRDTSDTTSSLSTAQTKPDTKTTTFSDKIKCSNWLWKTYEQLFACLHVRKNYINDGRISNGKPGQILVRFQPFTRGEHFEPYRNYSVHRWLYKKMEIERKGGAKKVRENLQSADLLDELKNLFCRNADLNNGYLVFRSLLSALWFRIPICIRRTLMISETEKTRLKHFDRVKLVNFFYVCIFKPLSILQVTETNTEPTPCSSSVGDMVDTTDTIPEKYRGCIFSSDYMTHLLLNFLKELVSSCSQTLLLQNNKTLTGYEARHFDEIKYIFDNTLSKDTELTSKNILYPSCSTIADLRKDGESKQFATSSSSLMTCPFSVKNKDKIYKNLEEETRLYVSHPKCLVQDLEGLGLSQKSELRKEFYSTDIEDLGSRSLNMAILKKKIGTTYYSSDNMESVCTSCSELCKGNSNVSKDVDGKKLYLYFQNPTDKFLKSIYKGDTKDL